ncbi:hypothetical protein JRQ81_006118 [Phrynocephalus forsythii]|uniref:Telomeric repeat-binding factor 2-interacting protein 1 n=1 Tax=Phrynocephalus forsythii TaxID=171643 RepID=A0A9Q0XET9_9SAUR|nr:hypothetical protein JRQ81_006118 [Phrynocephalus forsythii]
MPGLNLIRRRPWFAPKPRPCEDERRLFRLENGTRLSFYIRPGLTKMELAPLILRRGGKLCSAPEPEAILLACPGEVPEGATKVYISTAYVTDCIAQKTRLPLVKYLLNPQRSPSELAFTQEEDRAIMSYVQSSKQRGLADNLAGTTFWMDMAEARVTPHPWQAVRERYFRHLRRRRRRRRKKKKNTYQPGQNPKRIVPVPHRCGKCAGKEQVLRTPNTASSQKKKPTDASQTRDPGQTTGGSKTSGIFQRANREFEGSEEDRENVSPKEAVIPENAEPKATAEDEVPPDPKKQSVESTNGEDLAMSESLLPAEDLPSGPSAKDVALAMEDMKRFMEEFGVDLATVTQAFLKNSGVVAAAACCLKTGQRSDGCPLWTRQDDLDLLSGADDLRRKLLSKFGAENVNARVAFRKS